MLEDVNEGTSELMCHPGFVPDEFIKESSYNKPRQREFGILVDPAVRSVIEQRGIELVNFSNL
jgi:predicted glycoside hydrolase/deacetylase ChbG (UPF0249 family)